MIDGSAVHQVISLKPGEAFVRCRFVRIDDAGFDRIAEAKANIRGYLSPVVARAKEVRDRDYRIHTTLSFTRTSDIIVIGMIVIEEEEDDDIEI